MKSLSDWLVSKISRWLTKDRPPRRAYLCDFERIRYELRPGDVLLIEGRNRISRFIKKVTQSPWSHAALYVGRLHDIDNHELREKICQHYSGSSDNQLVIESLIGKGTIITPLSNYRHDHIRICRPQGLSRKDAQQIIGYAITRLGGMYNIRHVLDLARFLLPWGYFRRWHSVLFDRTQSQAIYDICSSMIAEAFHSVRFPILPVVKHDENGIELVQRNPLLYTPSDFDYSPYFDIIKYPFFSITEKPAYHHLPWKEGAISFDEEKDILVHPEVEESQAESKESTEKITPERYSKSLSELFNKLKHKKNNET
jgi:hypothetical protein